MPRRASASLADTILSYLLAPWCLRAMPRATPEQRLARAVWCRDHCATFAGRWILVAFGLWLVQISPLGFLFVWGPVPVLALLFPLAFILGIAHLVAQIVAQKRAGPPPIDPPVERDEERHRD
ncbi:hypothetical protein SAMN05421721_11116 [Ectothiorhodospira mobilis]|uniref:Uncharacterized protein n=1 Tax=Ectothiorhodospira mobilis TaxID=195064 RepID=A0A1I4RZ82_ECTMO|nr:hypothetical protein [Ectothiorhodospira mobilis]SFM57491.1 hypothetical protein SAMN05421721_11116 [Ectothiorhodospira mobilis]